MFFLWFLLCVTFPQIKIIWKWWCSPKILVLRGWGRRILVSRSAQTILFFHKTQSGKQLKHPSATEFINAEPYSCRRISPYQKAPNHLSICAEPLACTTTGRDPIGTVTTGAGHTLGQNCAAHNTIVMCTLLTSGQDHRISWQRRNLLGGKKVLLLDCVCTGVST